jgi:hypothetical protein
MNTINLAVKINITPRHFPYFLLAIKGYTILLILLSKKKKGFIYYLFMTSVGKVSVEGKLKMAN